MRERIRHRADLFFTLTLLGVFVLTALMVIVIGLKAYKKIDSNVDASYSMRTSLTYIQEKVRRVDENGAVKLQEIEDADTKQSYRALVIRQDTKEVPYVTYIYAYEGSLRELFTRGDVKPQLKSGTKITEVSDFELERVEGAEDLYRVRVTDENGQTEETYVSPKSRQTEALADTVGLHSSMSAAAQLPMEERMVRL